MTYLVSHLGEQLGRLTATEIVAKIQARELDALDYGFDEDRQDWVLLTELPEVAQQLAARKPAAPPKPKATLTHAVSEWYVLKGEAKFGPYQPEQMIALLQQKIVYPFDFCWHAGLTQWTRINALPEFAPEKIRAALVKTPDAFIARRFKRHKFEAAVLLHDQLTVWRGTAQELSPGGMGVRLAQTAHLAPGQELTLHCAAHDGLKAFNATCEVVAVAGLDGGAVEYGLRFLSLSENAQDSINAKVA